MINFRSDHPDVSWVTWLHQCEWMLDNFVHKAHNVLHPFLPLMCICVVLQHLRSILINVGVA